MSTGEICDQDNGSPVGLLSLRPLAFVDDIAKLNITTDDVQSSHARTLSFSKLKKLGLNVPKCCGMEVNSTKNSNTFPNLYVNGELIALVKSSKYLGDIINNKNNNEDMMVEREKKAIGKLISIFATTNEVTFGAYLYESLLIMYRAKYLPTLITNCQSWTNITNKNIEKLRILQLKYLKKMLRVPQATANCFIYLETGILPIDHEIWRRQFTFLHHILNLVDDDPVKVMYQQMKKLPQERNWANKITELRKTYDIRVTDEEIEGMSIFRFKNLIKTSIETVVFEELKSECAIKSKTKHLQYNSFTQQHYITELPPKLMYIVTRIRCSMLNTIHDRPYLYRGVEKCRVCNIGDESLHHIINCYVISSKIQTVCPSIFTDDFSKDYAKELAEYVERFYQAEMETAELE